MSLLVVIKGPVAMAGSMPCLSKIIGTNVPIRAATIITESIEPGKGYWVKTNSSGSITLTGN